jgi:predicted Zn-dependent protease
MNYFKRLFVIPYLVLFFGCVSPTGAFSFTIGEERQVGEKLLYAVRSHFELLDEPDIHQYLATLGKEVLDVAGVQFYDYHFFVIKNKEFNAFAAPSGLIFFHTGLIETMESEDELLSVLAHEIGHIVKRHISSKIDKGTKISIATMGLILASLALGGGVATQALFAGSIAAGQSANLHFSRLDEEEADLLAFGWMKAMRRDPRGQEKMLQTMRQLARYRSAIVPQYLLTHPNPEARLDYVQSLIASQKDEIQDFPEEENFDFLRFKFRVMSLTKENEYLRGYFSSILSSQKSSKQSIMMAKYGMALLERAENNFAGSLELMQEVISYFPDKNILNIDKGVIEYESGDVEMAYKTLLMAYDNDRTNVYATFSLAKVAYQLGMIDKAELLFKSVMYEIPEFPSLYYELGKLSSAKGNVHVANYYLGKYHLYQGKLKVARDTLTALQQADIDEELKREIKSDLELIDRLEK